MRVIIERTIKTIKGKIEVLENLIADEMQEYGNNTATRMYNEEIQNERRVLNKIEPLLKRAKI